MDEDASLGLPTKALAKVGKLHACPPSAGSGEGVSLCSHMHKCIGRNTGKEHLYARSYVTLISVLVLGSIAVSVAIGVSGWNMGSTLNSATSEASTRARALTSACAEQGLEQVRLSSSFTGTGNLSIGGGTCSYTVTNTGGESRTVTATSTITSVVRKITILISTLTPKIIVTSWQETP